MAIYMKYGKVDGDATGGGHEKWIDLAQVQTGFGRSISTPTGSAQKREASNPSVSEISCSKTMDRSSPHLFKFSTTGTKGEECTIDFTRTAEGSEEVYLQLKLKDTLITSYSVSSGGDRPSESLALNYTDIEVKYTKMGETGEAGDPVAIGFDLATGKSR